MANTSGEKELKSSWDELTASDSTKAVGHETNLIPLEGSVVPRRLKKGLE